MYRDEDINEIRSNLNTIIDKSYTEYKTKYEPNTEEVSQVYSFIKKYIIKNKIIVYGGFAQNILLMSKGGESIYKIINDAFYNWPNVADIEFYSPTPVKDLITLVNELNAMGFKHVTGGDGMHAGTYKIFVNFINYCDISYIPMNIYSNLPIITVDGIKCVHPHFMLCDAYRVLTDPLTSYWRLEKALRFNKILTYFPLFDIKQTKIEINSNTKHAEIMRFIRKQLIHESRLIVVGFYAYSYYTRLYTEHPYYEVISTNILEDTRYIEKVLKSKYKNDITIKQFTPFFTLIDRRIEFYYKNDLILRICDNNHRCTVYRYSKKKKTYFGTYNLVYMHFLFNYIYSIIFRTNEKILYFNFMNNISYIRDQYLEKHNKTVINNTRFKDFTFKCNGDPKDTIRAAHLKRTLVPRERESTPSRTWIRP